MAHLGQGGDFRHAAQIVRLVRYTAAGGSGRLPSASSSWAGEMGHPHKERLSSGHSQRISKSSRAAAETKARWTFRAATTVREPLATARYSMARMHWLEPSVE